MKSTRIGQALRSLCYTTTPWPGLAGLSAMVFVGGLLGLPDAAAAAQIDLPVGFTAYAIADGFSRTTSIALAADGTIYVSERHGTVFRLRDGDGDGVFEENVLFASGFEEITGLAVAPGGLV